MYRGGSDHLFFKQIFCQFQGPAPLDSRGRPRLSRAGSGQLGAPPTVQRPSQKVLKTQFNSKKGAEKKTPNNKSQTCCVQSTSGSRRSCGQLGAPRTVQRKLFTHFSWLLKISKVKKNDGKVSSGQSGAPPTVQKTSRIQRCSRQELRSRNGVFANHGLSSGQCQYGSQCCFFLNLPGLQARADRACDRLWQEMEKTWAQMDGTVPLATLHKEPGWRSEQCVL